MWAGRGPGASARLARARRRLGEADQRAIPPCGSPALDRLGVRAPEVGLQVQVLGRIARQAELGEDDQAGARIAGPLDPLSDQAALPSMSPTVGLTWASATRRPGVGSFMGWKYPHQRKETLSRRPSRRRLHAVVAGAALALALPATAVAQAPHPCPSPRGPSRRSQPPRRRSTPGRRPPSPRTRAPRSTRSPRRCPRSRARPGLGPALLARPTDGRRTATARFPEGRPGRQRGERALLRLLRQLAGVRRRARSDRRGRGQAPDYVEAVLEMAERSREVEVAPGPLGWAPPKPDRDGCGPDPVRRVPTSTSSSSETPVCSDTSRPTRARARPAASTATW